MAAYSRLVFSGGGAKGVVLAGAYRALKEHHILKEVKEVSGASAGALMAALSAFGASSEQVDKAILEQRIDKLIAGPYSPGVFSDGTRLLNFLREQINKAILDYFESKPYYENKKKEDDKKHAHALAVCQKARESKNTKNEITFSDLKALADFDNEHFKSLYVNACRYPDGQKKVFGHQDTNNIEVAKACLASAALPIKFSLVEIAGERYFDGGWRDNIPHQNFPDPQCTDNDENNNASTLIFAFDERNGCVSRALDESFDNDELYTPSFADRMVRDQATKLTMWLDSQAGNNTAHKNEGFKGLRNFRSSTIGLIVGGITTTAFSKAHRVKHQLSALGYLKTHQFLVKHGKVKDDKEITFNSDVLALLPTILKALLKSQGKSENDVDNYMNKHDLSKVETLSNYCNEHINSRLSFSFALAVKYASDETFSFKDLQREVYLESFRRSLISTSNVTGRRFFLA